MNDPDRPSDPAPFNPLPAPVAILALLVAGIELVFFVADQGLLGDAVAAGMRTQAIQDFAFLDQYFEWMLENNAWPLDGLMRFVTYPFINYSFTGALFGVVFILALGKFVGEAMGGLTAVLIFVVSSALAAGLYGLVINDQFPLVGAMVGAYGLIGAFTYILATQLETMGQNQLRAFQLLALLMGIQLLFALIFGGPPQWLADLFGALIGFVIAATLRPGGLLERIRRD